MNRVCGWELRKASKLFSETREEKIPHRSPGQRVNGITDLQSRKKTFIDIWTWSIGSEQNSSVDCCKHGNEHLGFIKQDKLPCGPAVNIVFWRNVLHRGDRYTSKYTWRSWIRASWYDYENNKQDATIQVNLLFLVGCTCFGRCFRPSSGALDCIYSFW